MEKEKIQEVIVVEGKHDTMTLKEIFDCETIETGGTSLSESVFQRIEEAIKKLGLLCLQIQIRLAIRFVLRLKNVSR